MNRGTVLWIVQQAMGSLGLPVPTSVVGNSDTVVTQFMFLLNDAGADLTTANQWEELISEWAPTIVAGTDNYALPSDWACFIDQTQWDRTNHWPLLGPRSASEWQWLKGGMLSSGPRTRYRVRDGKLWLHPVPASPAPTIVMEYVRTTWIVKTDTTRADAVTADTDMPIFDKWLITRMLKLKFLEAKGLDTTAAQSDFMNLFNTITGRDTGAAVVDLSGRPQSLFLGPNNIADGSWNVTP